MKNPVLGEAHVKQLLYRCIVCDTPTEGFYGRWGSGGTCSRVCELAQEAKPKHPDHPVEDFQRRFGIT